MAGHSKWAQIKRQKGVNDAKRGQLFTRLGNAIAIAARNGTDPTMNPNLAMAVDKAKAANMPASNIERAIKRGSGQLEGQQIQELLFEGYGAGGVGIIVETATDNRNRTTSEIRAAFSKGGGNLAESGAVAYQFEHKGLIRITAPEDDETILQILEAGAEDVQAAGEDLVIYTGLKQLGSVRDELIKRGYKIEEASLAYVPNNIVEIEDPKVLEKIERLIEALEEQNDVTEVYANFDVVGEAAKL